MKEKELIRKIDKFVLNQKLCFIETIKEEEEENSESPLKPEPLSIRKDIYYEDQSEKNRSLSSPIKISPFNDQNIEEHTLNKKSNVNNPPFKIGIRRTSENIQINRQKEPSNNKRLTKNIVIDINPSFNNSIDDKNSPKNNSFKKNNWRSRIKGRIYPKSSVNSPKIKSLFKNKTPKSTSMINLSKEIIRFPTRSSIKVNSKGSLKKTEVKKMVHSFLIKP